MGVGAMTDFGPLLANPRTLLLGAAAQFGIFATVLGALTLNYFGIISFTLPQAAAIGIIGGADGPTAIYLSGKLAPELLGAIAVAAYSYMALVPLIQPPIMKALTTDKERKIRMVQLRTVSKREKILFPAVLLLLVALLLPDAAPLLGMFCFGNLMRESGVVERLSDSAERADQHRHHLPRAVGGGQAGGGQVPAAADAGDPGAGGDRLLRGDRRRGADGEADERVQPAQNQPADRLGGGVGGADGGAGVEQGGSGSGRAELPADARHGSERGGGDRLGDRRRGDAQVRAGDVSQPVPAAGKPAAEISHKETVMNEGIACCPENRTSTREAVVDAMLASGDELAQLQPALNLLSPPLNATPGEALLASCYEAGADHNAEEATRAVSALPAAVVRSATPSLQRSGLLCMAAGALSARQLPLTHNRLCDVAGQFARAIPEGDEEAGSGFYTVRSVSLPVYRRLRRDNHSHSVCLQQALLHLLAWKSDSPWARQQAQRLLWQGGVLGEKGEFALLTLDDELRERQIVWPALRSLLAVTGFLVRFPAGPVFSD